MTATRDTALEMLRESRDGARVWFDNGRTVRRLAAAAGVRVTYMHVTLGHEMTVEYRTIDISEKEGGT